MGGHFSILPLKTEGKTQSIYIYIYILCFCKFNIGLLEYDLICLNYVACPGAYLIQNMLPGMQNDPTYVFVDEKQISKNKRNVFQDKKAHAAILRPKGNTFNYMIILSYYNKYNKIK